MYNNPKQDSDNDPYFQNYINICLFVPLLIFRFKRRRKETLYSVLIIPFFRWKAINEDENKIRHLDLLMIIHAKWNQSNGLYNIKLPVLLGYISNGAKVSFNLNFIAFNIVMIANRSNLVVLLFPLIIYNVKHFSDTHKKKFFLFLPFFMQSSERDRPSSDGLLVTLLFVYHWRDHGADISKTFFSLLYMLRRDRKKSLHVILFGLVINWSTTTNVYFDYIIENGNGIKPRSLRGRYCLFNLYILWGGSGFKFNGIIIN